MKDEAPMLRTMGKQWLIMLPFFYVSLSPINISKPVSVIFVCRHIKTSQHKELD